MTKRVFVVFIAILTLVSCIGIMPEAAAQNDESYFKATFLDVGEGDAAYIECDGYTMLIDGGDVSCSSLIYSFLKEHDVKRLDYIVASHPDADHIGGISGALNCAQSGIVLCPVNRHDTKPFEDFIKYLEVQNNHITVPDRGDTFSFGSAKILYAVDHTYGCFFILIPMLLVYFSSASSCVLYSHTSLIFNIVLRLELIKNGVVSRLCESLLFFLEFAHHSSLF